MIHVIAIIAAKPGQRDNILAHARANLAAVRAGGCIGTARPTPTGAAVSGQAGRGHSWSSRSGAWTR